eukprot:COSAG02_NODE_36588_length_453_cov_0.564972_1_plen_91_part_01
MTCTPHIFNQYECIFGLTGSVGGSAEREYLLETYSAEIFTVPRFLETCTGDDGKVVKDDDMRLYDDEGQQHRAVVDLAKEMTSTVPVLVIT